MSLEHESCITWKSHNEGGVRKPRGKLWGAPRNEGGGGNPLLKKGFPTVKTWFAVQVFFNRRTLKIPYMQYNIELIIIK